MENVKLVTGNSPAEIWKQIGLDLSANELIDYEAIIQQPGLPKIAFEVEADMGGGFEGGYEWTRFSAPLEVPGGFRFALHHQHFLDILGKFLGLEDKLLGYEEFDKAFIVKTNDEERVKQAFVDVNVRDTFQMLEHFTLHIAHHDGSKESLDLEIEEAITDIAELEKIYTAFNTVLMQLQA